MIKDIQESNARKAKGEKLQKHIVTEVKSRFPDHAASIKSSKMSAHGEDIKITSDEARSAFPFSIEAKYKDKGLTSVYSAMEQAGRQVESLTSTLTIHGVAAIQQQGKDPLIVMNMQDWLDLTQKLRALSANREGGV